MHALETKIDNCFNQIILILCNSIIIYDFIIDRIINIFISPLLL